MKNTVRRTVAAVGTLAVATTGLIAMSAVQAEELAPSRVTVASTDYTPASGQTFRLSGGVWSEGTRVPARIRVKTYRHGEWVMLTGAVMDTNRFDRYSIGIILRMKGERLLRVIADPADDDISTARRTITVSVH